MFYGNKVINGNLEHRNTKLEVKFIIHGILVFYESGGLRIMKSLVQHLPSVVALHFLVINKGSTLAFCIRRGK